MTGVCVIGVGNPYRRDDAAGLAVARAVGTAAPPGVRVREHDGEPASLLDLWADAESAFVVDMVRSGAPSGTVHWIEICGGGDLRPPSRGRSSSHHFNLGDAVGLGRMLDRLPARLTLVGVEGADHRAGCGLTHDVALGVREATRRILRSIQETDRRS
jgi:hydrogenase maturation protease